MSPAAPPADMHISRTDTQPHPRWPAGRSSIMWLVIGVMPLALLLRSWPLGATYCLDEATSVAIARLDWTKFVTLLSHREANMTFYYLVLKAWSVLSTNETFVRTLSVIFALATLPVLYALGARLFGPHVAIASTLLLSVNSLHIVYGQIARSYSLVVFLVTLSALLFVKGVEQPSWRIWAGYAITTVLALYSHFFALFVVIAQWGSLWFLRDRRVPWDMFVPAALIVALSTIPLGLFVLKNNVGQVAWIMRPDPSNVVQLFTTLSGGGVLHVLAYIAACVLAFGNGADIAFVRARREVTARISVFSPPALGVWSSWFMLAWFLVPIVLAFAISMATPIWVTYYFIICLPPLMILVALGLSRIRPTVVFASVLAIVVVVALNRDVRHVRYSGEDWRDATAEVLTEGRPNDALLFYHPYIRQAFELYRSELGHFARGPEVVFPARWDPSISVVDIEQHPSETLLNGLPARYPRVWLFTAYDGFEPRRSASHAIQASLTHSYRFRRVDEFPGGITVQLYGERELLPSVPTAVRSGIMRECP